MVLATFLNRRTAEPITGHLGLTSREREVIQLVAEGKSTKEKREAMREQISEAYVRLYEELRHQFQLDDASIP